METGLQTVNRQRKLGEWAERVSACRSSVLSIKTWCRENGVSEQTYYTWQRRLYELAQNQQENRFADVTPQGINRSGIAVTVQFGGVELAIRAVVDCKLRTADLNLDIGLAQGITDNVGAVTAAVQAVGATTIAAMTAVCNQIVATGNSIVN